MDDKHAIKVGEPSYRVAAVDRGKSVFIGKDTAFSASDHDFTKCKLTPSVSLLVDIPGRIEDSRRSRVPHIHQDAFNIELLFSLCQENKVRLNVIWVLREKDQLEDTMSYKLSVRLSDSINQSSSPLRHAAKLIKVLKALKLKVNAALKPCLLLHTDGGPEHRVTYVSAQAALICLLHKLQLDFLVAAN